MRAGDTQKALSILVRTAPQSASNCSSAAAQTVARVCAQGARSMWPLDPRANLAQWHLGIPPKTRLKAHQSAAPQPPMHRSTLEMSHSTFGQQQARVLYHSCPRPTHPHPCLPRPSTCVASIASRRAKIKGTFLPRRAQATVRSGSSEREWAEASAGGSWESGDGAREGR